MTYSRMERQRKFSSCRPLRERPYKRDLPNQRTMISHIQLMQTAYSPNNRKLMIKINVSMPRTAEDQVARRCKGRA